jgi:hypothetical protein
VTTLDDFGTRGEPPSHPELLDWLAVAFQSPATSHTSFGLAWSQKQLIRLIVTSSTYRQSSRYRPDLAERDPSNVWLARQNRFRLEAENVRDAYLAASGLLNAAMGGPSVRPPLPADIAAIGYADSIKWKESQGADKYRRGLYIFFQRTVPYPMLTTFDCRTRMSPARAVNAEHAVASAHADERPGLFRVCPSARPEAGYRARSRCGGTNSADFRDVPVAETGCSRDGASESVLRAATAVVPKQPRECTQSSG